MSRGKHVNLRTIEEIEQDFQRNCLEAGQMQFQLEMLKEDLQRANQKLGELNREARARWTFDQKDKAGQAKQEPLTEVNFTPDAEQQQEVS